MVGEDQEEQAGYDQHHSKVLLNGDQFVTYITTLHPALLQAKCVTLTHGPSCMFSITYDKTTVTSTYSGIGNNSH